MINKVDIMPKKSNSKIIRFRLFDILHLDVCSTKDYPNRHLIYNVLSTWGRLHHFHHLHSRFLYQMPRRRAVLK